MWNIYVLRGLESGLYKIGRSRDVQKRIRTHAAALEPVRLVATFPAPKEMERELHDRFAALLARSRKRGREWFRDGAALREWIASLPAEARVDATAIPGPSAVRQGYVNDRLVSHEELQRARAKRHADLFAYRHGHPFVAGHHVDGCAHCTLRRESIDRANAKRAATRLRKARRGARCVTPLPLQAVSP